MLLAVVSGVELVAGKQANFVGLFAAVPFLAAVFAFWQTVLVVGVLSTIVGLVLIGVHGSLGPNGMVNILSVVLATAIASVVARRT